MCVWQYTAGLAFERVVKLMKDAPKTCSLLLARGTKYLLAGAVRHAIAT